MIFKVHALERLLLKTKRIINILKTNKGLLPYLKNYVERLGYYRLLNFKFVDIYYKTPFAIQNDMIAIYMKHRNV